MKALGQDERSADLLFRMFRYVQRRDLGDERPFSSLRRAVEHEAFLALVARDVGIRTPRLSAFATAEPHAFVLAYEAIDGSSLDGLEAEQSPTSCSPRSGSSWRRCEPNASLTVIFVWPTSSWPATASFG